MLPLVKGMETVFLPTFFGRAKLCHRPRMAKKLEKKTF